MMTMAAGDGSPLRQGAETGLDWFSVDSEACGGGTPDLFCSPMFLGYMDIYIGERSRSGEPQGAHEGGGAQGGRRASLPRGHLVASLTCTPSLLDCFRSKNNSPEGFIPFGLRLIFLFFKTLKQGKKQELALGSGLIG